jgi:hypothetical protein
VQELAANPPPIGDHPGRCIDNVVINAPKRQGNAPDYLTARIARDHPEILERMKAGEFRSVRAAALAAGTAKPTRESAPNVGNTNNRCSMLSGLVPQHGNGASSEGDAYWFV